MTNVENMYDGPMLKRLVEEKEKEWRQLAELRADKAEAEVDRLRAEVLQEKDNLQKLKTDFSYNLQLLADRDRELDIAENSLEKMKEAYLDAERKASDLQVKGDTLKTELERTKQFQSEQLEKLRENHDKQLNKMSTELAAQQQAVKIAKEQLEERLSEVEANFMLDRKQLEEGFENELDRMQKNSDAQLDEVRGKMAIADTEARLLAKELELLRETDRKKRAEIALAEKSLEHAKEQIRQLEWSLADKSASFTVDVRELQQRFEICESDRELEKISYEQRLAQTNKDLADKVMQLERIQRSRYEDAGEAGKRMGDMQGEISRLKASLDKQNYLEEELRNEKESLVAYKIQLDNCEAQILTLTEANGKLETALRLTKENGGDESLTKELQQAKYNYSMAQNHVNRLEEQNRILKEAVRQMKEEVEGIISQGAKPEKDITFQKRLLESKWTQTDASTSFFSDKVIIYDDFEVPKNIELPGDPRLRAYVDSLVQRTSSLQHRCSELVAEGRRQQIRAESATAQLETVEHDCQRLRSALEHARYELSADRSRSEADKLATKKQVADLEERLAEARVIADEFHAEANNANSELGELRRRLASREVTQKYSGTGVGFGGQELYIQQLEDQLKDFATRAKPEDAVEANARLTRAISIIVQLQKDRIRLLDLAARLRATAEEYQLECENLQKRIPAVDGKVPSTARSIGTHSQLDKLETLAYERMRENLARQMAEQRKHDGIPPINTSDLIDGGDDNLSMSFPNSEAIQDLLNQIDNATSEAAPSELAISANRARLHRSPTRVINSTRQNDGNLHPKSPKTAGRGRALSRVWVSDSSPPPVAKGGGRSVKSNVLRKPK